jgi:hypothetical protein
MSSDSSDTEAVTITDQRHIKRPCSQGQLDHLAAIRLKAVEARRQRALARKVPVASEVRKKVTSYKPDLPCDSESSDDEIPQTRRNKYHSSLKQKVECLEKQLLKLHYKQKYSSSVAAQPAVASTPPVVVHTAPTKNPDLQEALTHTLQKSILKSQRQMDFPSPLNRLF